ncbi:hypothetical protein A7985_14630 [Pseudoalteromonas luteoviolacea]|uniref:Uncharacterized protein n=1 Tax=Pseudoalteromonas luteoviolacea TaxID=43657 RepID=A0A1C0TQ19_9GAMM|nr:hypothetical protein A7985_14630 [Pseudoalteromonas luteoviolacea]
MNCTKVGVVTFAPQNWLKSTPRKVYLKQQVAVFIELPMKVKKQQLNSAILNYLAVVSVLRE